MITYVYFDLPRGDFVDIYEYVPPVNECIIKYPS